MVLDLGISVASTAESPPPLLPLPLLRPPNPADSTTSIAVPRDLTSRSQDVADLLSMQFSVIKFASKVSFKNLQCSAAVKTFSISLYNRFKGL
jgi:hypothetical protein